ncbi:MAG: GldG family protein [Calditrichaeota bacterium]|nr:GldG family protein [Calditrichota bacterium]
MKKLDNIIGIVGIVFVFAALIWYSISQVWQVYHWVLLLLGIIGLGYFGFVFYKNREKAVSKRSLKYGSNVTLQVIVVLAIIAMLAFITTRRHFRFDWTSTNLYSLSDQTIKILDNLKKDVKITAFFKTSEQRRARDLLDEYNYRSSHLTYQFIDPDERPEVAKQYGIRKYGTLAVESGLKKELVEKMTEANITNAIIKVTRDKEKVIYFLTGHGERSINDESAEGYKNAVDAIKKENYLVRELNLVRSKNVPDSCTVLAIVGPKTNFFPGELDSIKKYLDNGGKLLLMVDPEHPSDIADFAAKYRVMIGNDMVIDVSGMGQLFGAGPGMPLVTKYDSNNQITKDFNIMTFYPLACSVTPMKDKDGFKITELLKTSGNSWADTDYQNGKVAYDPEKDKKGPITLGVVVEKSGSKGKTVLVIFGDSDFAKNGFFKNQGNRNLFLNTVNYLAEEEDLISIRPKEVDDRRLTMTQADVKGLFYLVVIAIPLLVIILGVVIFIRRNR